MGLFMYVFRIESETERKSRRDIVRVHVQHDKWNLEDADSIEDLEAYCLLGSTVFEEIKNGENRNFQRITGQ